MTTRRAALACAAALVGSGFSGGPPLPATVDPMTGPGVSIELAQFRARTVSDVRYRLIFDLRSDSTLSTTAGRVTIHWKRTGSDDAIVDFRGPRITAATVNGAPLAASAFNGAHVRIPAAMLTAGEDSAHFDFTSDIAPTGASIIRTHDPDGSDYLYTLLVPEDANQLFPCFDQPDLKARVTLVLTVPSTWTVLANGTLEAITVSGNRDAQGARMATARFAETKPISTYLIAFAAGPWVMDSSRVNGRKINVFVRKSRAKEADLDTLLALNQRAVSWMESYFGIPYPFEKFDFLLAPAFPFGGMEHPGAIFFNENSFIFRDKPTLTRRLGRFSTILHEVAHQWFGDLVTMRWFDDLWLKEGFATYMAAKAQYSLDSTTGAWKTFYQSNKPAAYGVDQTTGTNSLWQKLDNLDQAKSNYGAIVYNKAPSVLKQLNYLVGEDAFQRGIRQFLTDHAYANATWQDLLGSVGKAANMSLDDFGKNFMLRPGMQIVEQRLTIAGGKITKLELVQRPAQPMSGTAPWPMRTQVLLSYGSQPPVTIPVELRDRVTDVVAARGKPAPSFVFANYGDYGYFLTMLDSASIRSLESGALGAVTDPFLRTMLWGALWDQVRDAQFDPVRFARLAIREMPREKDEQIFPGIVTRLNRVVTVYASPAAHAALLPEVERALWDGAADRSRPYGIRRAYIDGFIGVAESRDALAKLTTLLSADSVAGEPMLDPTRWEIVNRLTIRDAPRAAELVAAQAARDTTPD